jgi:hypothetical protein
MVIAPDQADGPAIPVLELRVASQPAGAAVFIQMQRIGVTPLEYDWRSAQARVGGELTLVLEHPGFAPRTIRRKIEASKMNVSAVLQPLEPEQPAEPPPPAAPPPAAEPPPAAAAADPSSAAPVEADDDEVLQIRPVRLGEEPAGDPDEEAEAEEEDDAPEIEPNPFR